MDLFEENLKKDNKNQLLAARMRPAKLDDFVGQLHILGKGKLLRRAIEADRLGSVVLFGPSGCGKTSLAWCIANVTQARYQAVNATTSNVEEDRKSVV